MVIDTGLARLNFAHLAHSLLLTRALGQRVQLDTQLLQQLAVVPHTVLALLFNLLLALNQQDQLVFKPAILVVQHRSSFSEHARRTLTVAAGMFPFALALSAVYAVVYTLGGETPSKVEMVHRFVADVDNVCKCIHTNL